MSKATGIALDSKISEIKDLPYTISFIIRKRQQVDSFLELPKEKQPPEKLIWDSSSEELDGWLERVLSGKQQSEFNFVIRDDEIE